MKKFCMIVIAILNMQWNNVFAADFTDFQRCGGTIITIGWELNSVIEACGVSLSNESYMQPYFYDNQRVGPKQIHHEKVDLLTYEFSNNYITTIEFRNNALFKMYEKRKY